MRIDLATDDTVDSLYRKIRTAERTALDANFALHRQLPRGQVPMRIEVHITAYDSLVRKLAQYPDRQRELLLEKHFLGIPVYIDYAPRPNPIPT